MSSGTEDGSEEWGYIPLRPGASMFYWFYRTSHPDGYLNRPIILWLQGGPGLSGTGHGNFLEFGPLNQNLEPRNISWIQTANILFVDNPVESGFSLVENTSYIPDTIEEISLDLITMLKVFMNEHPCFRTNPFYIFGQSYGGKMTAALTYYLHKAIKAEEIQCNLTGAGIGNGWVSGTDIMVNWAPMFYQMSLIDDIQLKHLTEIAWKAWSDGNNNGWDGVNNGWDNLFWALYEYFPNNNWYNILDLYKVIEYDISSEVDGDTKRRRRNVANEDFLELGSMYDIDISDLMNGPIRKKLGIIPSNKIWGEGKPRTQQKQFESRDLFKPVWHLVDEVLKTSNIEIIVYSGQLDIICNTSGALRWMRRLTWSGKKEFDKAERKMLTNPVTNFPEMFVKSHGQLKMYWVLNSGHAVPHDDPDVAFRMLNRILNDTD